MKKSGYVDDDVKISAVVPFHEMDEKVVTSEKCWNGIEEQMLEISREVH